jgi:splicing suppressor protein 51
MPTTTPRCQNCSKSSAQLGANLKQCGKCHTTRYCSRECQVAHWPSHKPICTIIVTARDIPLDNVDSEIDSERSAGYDRTDPSDPALSPNAVMLSGMFHPIETLLHLPPRSNVFQHLIDAYRLRIEDEYVFTRKNIGLYAREPPLPSFRRYLSLAEGRRGLLPGWWNPSARKECEDIAMGRKGDSWSQIAYAVEKHDIQDYYGDSMMPMMLRLVAEHVYGKPVGSM